MAALLWVTTTLLMLHAAHSYILLTANMEDVQAIAKQMLSSPVADQLSRIWRRATAQFNQKLKRPKIQKRADEDRDSDRDDSNNHESSSFRRRSQEVLNQLAALGKNASFYLTSLRRAFNDFTRE